jgi:hypothetical protein
MAGVMRDIQILLYKAKENGNQFLGEDEIFPVAFLTKDKTRNQLFNGAHFCFGYSGITSPEIRDALGLFKKNVASYLKEEPVPDTYFKITQIGEEEIKPFMEKLTEENGGWESIVEEILKTLENDREGLIVEAKERLMKR